MPDDAFRAEMAGAVPVVAAPEEIDITSAGAPRSALLTAAANGHGRLVVDMTQTRPWEAGRIQAARLEFDAQARRFEQAKAQLQATLDQVRNGRPRRQILHDSAFARLQAKLESMPVIEQAKGILMAQQRCGPDEAFELLRRASQRANVKVSVLAVQIVEQVASPRLRRHPAH